MIPFTIDLPDFEGYTNKQILASDTYSKGRKSVEFNTQYDPQKQELITGFRVVQTFKNEPNMTKVHPASTLAEVIVKFNEIH